MEKTYFIFSEQTEEFIGTVLATSIADAEYIACGTFLDHETTDMYALSADSF